MKKKNLAFTLAEVLIVIGIIGVVAALTLPNLNHATGDKEKVTKVKKIYSALTDAVDRAQVIYGGVDTWGNGLSTDAEKNERFAKRVTEFLKVSKDCGFDEGCFSSAPLLFADGEVSFDNYLESKQGWKEYMVTLSDGMSLSFRNLGQNISIDIDGPNKGKNQYGNDLFEFTIGLDSNDDSRLYQQIMPDVVLEYVERAGWNTCPGCYATAWVIENGNLDYLKCPNELNWETKTSCH